MNKQLFYLATTALIAGFLGTSSTKAAVLQLDSTMNSSSFISEDAITGETFIISNGDGTVANGTSGDDDSNPAFGSLINLFPNETDFSVGELTYDDAGATGSGTEIFSITGLDLSEFWSADPTRTTGGDATVLSDISDFAIGVWLFENPGSITFGALDASDTVTFTDGTLTSVDLSVTTAFSTTDGGSNTVIWNGTFSISGANISYQINDTQPFDTGIFGVFNSNLQADVTGTVDAVPEPSTYLLLGLGLACIAVFYRKKTLQS